MKTLALRALSSFTCPPHEEETPDEAIAPKAQYVQRCMAVATTGINSGLTVRMGGMGRQEQGAEETALPLCVCDPSLPSFPCLRFSS